MGAKSAPYAGFTAAEHFDRAPNFPLPAHHLAGANRETPDLHHFCPEVVPDAKTVPAVQRYSLGVFVNEEHIDRPAKI